MTWSDVGDFLKGSAPKLAGLLIGGPTGVVAGELLSKVLGTPNEPEKVMETLKNDPTAMLKVLELNNQLEMAKIKERMNETTQAAQIIKTEAASNDTYVSRTRPKILRDSFSLLAIMMVTGFISLVVLAQTGLSKESLTLIGSYWIDCLKFLTGFVTVGFTGYVRYRSVHDKRLQAGKEPATGLIEGLLRLKLTKKQP